MIHDQSELFRRRERQERAAAKNAQSLAVRRVHQQMAEAYAARLEIAARDASERIGWRTAG